MAVSQNKGLVKKPPSQPLSTFHFEDIYPQCKKVLDNETWERFLDDTALIENPELFSEKISEIAGDSAVPDFLPDLARLELAYHRLKTDGKEIPEKVDA